MDYKVGEKIAILQLIHHDRFNPQWIEYHHPRLTRVYLEVVRKMKLPDGVKEGVFGFMG